MNRMIPRSPLAMFLAYRARKKAERRLKAAEHRRSVIMGQIEYRRDHKREFRPMFGMLRETTNASLAASCGREWPGEA